MSRAVAECGVELSADQLHSLFRLLSRLDRDIASCKPGHYPSVYALEVWDDSPEDRDILLLKIAAAYLSCENKDRHA
jgi:hypothetical protein